jgi:hypothetical protein
MLPIRLKSTLELPVARHSEWVRTNTPVEHKYYYPPVPETTT